MDTSPIDAALLEPTLAPLPATRGLPGACYASQAVFDWEIEHFFEGSWVCVGRSADLDKHGDQRAVTLGRESALLVRDEAGLLRCFLNVCAHRGHQLLAVGNTTNGASIRCPYHAWSYRLDGVLCGAPRFTNLAPTDFDRETLAPVRVVEWQWLFPPEAADLAGFDPAYAVDFWDRTNRQDWDACASVQRGVSSRGYRPGPLSIAEDNVHQFQTMVARGYLTGRPVLPDPAFRTAFRE